MADRAGDAFAGGSRPARAQVPEDLAAPKHFRALRLSSADPRHHNGDSRPIAPGATLELGGIAGQGRITHIWFTIAGKSPDHLRELVFRIYWDGAVAAVECPLGDFFAQGFGRYVEFPQRADSHRRREGVELLLADAIRQGRQTYDDQRRERAGQRLLLQH